MSNEFYVLTATAASLGFIHTIFGPDHYLPFIVTSKARRWSAGKTMLITFLCGLGHIGSSLVLGAVGIVLGVAVFKLEGIEAARGDLASWLLLIFGLAYFVWGIHQAIRDKPHTHHHRHVDSLAHAHPYDHRQAHSHVHHTSSVHSPNITPGVLFTIFVFGPCEPFAVIDISRGQG